MKARASVARVSGRAMRTGAPRRSIALCWPRTAKATVSGPTSVSHAHRHLHALQVNVRVRLEDRAHAPPDARAPVIDASVSKTLRETNAHRTTLRELRTMLVTHTRASRVEQRSVERHARHSVRTSTIASRVHATTLIAPRLTISHQGRRTTHAAPLSATKGTREALRGPDVARPARSLPAAGANVHATARELVWRTPDAAREVDRTAAPSAHPTAQTASHRPSSQTAPAELAGVVAAQVREATIAFTAPEGPALDRLANEVMRRVEKTLRIERERRGR